MPTSEPPASDPAASAPAGPGASAPGANSAEDASSELGLVRGDAQLEHQDVVEALNAQPGSRFKTAVGLAISSAAVVVVIQSTSENASPPWLVIGILFAAPLLARFGKRLVAARMLKSLPPAQRSVKLEVSKQGVLLSSQGASTRLPWSKIISTRETRKVFLIYTSPTAFVIVPKRAFDAPGQVQVAGALARHAGAPGATAKMWQPQLLLWALLGLALTVLIVSLR